MDYTEILGFAAGILTTLALVPQAMKTWKTKLTRDISFGWVTILIVGVFLWLVYGILIDSLPIITANFASFILVFVILIFKIIYK